MLSVEVTATRPGYASGVARSAATAPVAKATASMTAQVTPRKPRAGHRVKVVIGVTASPAVAVTGQVEVRVDGKLVRTVALADDATAKVALRLGKGKHQVVVTYLGLTHGRHRTARATVKVRVRRR